ncbi:MAG: MFS transporter [Planctomycetes bacterium]|jgi:MFS family permease|nr:MFS transporter [Planctomycetota bacterium]
MNFQRDGIAPNAGRLLWAGFFAILAAGVGFSIRGGIVNTWRAEFGFTDQQIGSINTAAFSAFCFGIIGGGMLCDRLGYRALVVAAFVFHLVSAVTAYFTGVGDAAFALKVLYWGSFVFGLANGTLEAVANPLVATLFPNHRTHYLNILHASWPAGLVLGGLACYFVQDSNSAQLTVPWQLMLALFLVPTLFYGVLFFGQAMPKSAATQKGLPLADMFQDVGLLGAIVVCTLLSQFFGTTLGLPPAAAYGLAGAGVVAVGVLTKFSLGSFLLFTLFVAHMLIGAVELGTDSWINSITGNFLTPAQGQILFVFTSLVMFGLRFCAGWIERLGLSPIGILLVSAILACIGLNLTAGIETFAGALLALSIYAIGKTFFWPTMLAVASDRFPRTGAIAISVMGGIGMLSAGLGGPGLGYAKDRFAGAELLRTDAALHAKVQSAEASKFLMFDEVRGIDGKQLAAAKNALEVARGELVKAGDLDPGKAMARLSTDERALVQASIAGDRQALRVDSVIPAAMAVIYLLLALWFKSRGGYRVLSIDDQDARS